LQPQAIESIGNMPRHRLGSYDKTALETSKRAKVASIIFFVVAMFLVVLTIGVPVGGGSSAREIYTRNISTVLAFFAMSNFFGKYSKLQHEGNTRAMQSAAFILFLASLVKIGIAIRYFAICLINGNIILAYYIGEFIVWLAVAFFAISYYRRINFLLHKRSEQELENEDDS